MIFTNLIETNLRTKKIGKQIEYYQRIESTNDEAWEIIDSVDTSHGTIIITDNQLSGKGRNGNTWFMSPSKGLAMSIILKQPISIQDGLLVPIAAGVAVAQALENRGGNPKLKWPNDILLNNKKCGGILSESRVKNNSITHMIIGFGLNINETVNDFPSLLSDSATSLAIETNQSNQRELICAIIATYFERLLNDLPSSLPIWENYCNHLNEIISFSQNGQNQSGIFKGLSDDGRARIQIDKKEILFNSITLE